MTSGAAEQPQPPKEVAVLIPRNSPAAHADWLLRNAERWAATAGVPKGGIELLVVFGSSRSALDELHRLVERQIGSADPVGGQLRRWLGDRCSRDEPNAWTRVRDLHADHKEWAKAARVSLISETLFSQRLKGLGIEYARHTRNRRAGFRGVALIAGGAAAE